MLSGMETRHTSDNRKLATGNLGDIFCSRALLGRNSEKGDLDSHWSKIRIKRMCGDSSCPCETCWASELTEEGKVI